MIGAILARIKTNEKNFDNCEKELEEIEEAILKSIDKGEFCTTISGKISHQAEEVLKRKGYKIEYGGRYNEVDTAIRW